MRVLQIEQSLLFKKIIKDLVSNLGGELFLAESIQDAFNILKKEQISFIIISANLSKNASSEEFLVRLTNSGYRGIPVVIITGNDDIETKRKFFSLGATEVMLKKDLHFDYFAKILDSFAKEDRIKEKLKSIRIAVIDDSKLVLNIVKNIFVSQDIKNIDCYNEPKGFVDVFSQDLKSYNLFLVDIIMPDITGDAIVKKIREKDSTSPIVVMSSLSNYTAITPLMDLGADDYISKPFVTDSFMITIRNSIKKLILYETLKDRGLNDIIDLFN